MRLFHYYVVSRSFLDKKDKHTLWNEESVPLKLVEVQIGDYLEEDDIVRFEDVYDRV